MRVVQVVLCSLAMALAAGLAPAARAATMENDQVRVTVDTGGRVAELVNKAWPHFNLIAHPAEGFWRLNLQKEKSLENIVWPDQQTYRVEQSADAITVSVDSVKMRDETLPIKLVFRITLAGNEVHWSATVDNHSGYTIADVYLPDLGGIGGLGQPDRHDDLYWPQGLGKRLENFSATLSPRQDGFQNLSVAVNRLQNPYIELIYPSWGSMDWCTLNNGERGIYLAANDPEVSLGSIQAGKRFVHGNGLFFALDKYAFVRPGETWKSADYVTSFYQGDWHVAADKYRAFLKTWRPVREKPDWVRNLQGMFLVIMHQQYGDVLWQYKDLPWLLEQARKNGMDTLGVFGWTEGGHDNQYQEFRPAEAMGGRDALRDALNEVKQQHGNTILYLQGHLIDPTTPEYPNAVKDYAARNIWGTPYYEEYSKFSESSFMRNFSRKTFTPACADAPGWIDLLKEKGSETMALGPTGVIYDQVGGMTPYPCFNTGLNNKPPYAAVQGRLRLLDALRSNLRAQQSDAGFMAEIPNDAFSQYLDIVHCAGTSCQYEKEAFPDLFRYTVPDVILTARHPATRPEPVQVNYAFTYGLRFELEVRYREEGDELRANLHPEMSEYLQKLSALRKRHWDLLGTGTFLNANLVSEPNRNLTVTLYGAGARRAVVVWNNTKSAQSANPVLKGFKALGSDGIDAAGSAAGATLEPQHVRVWLFEQISGGRSQ